MSMVIKNGRIIAPGSKVSSDAEILIEGGRIAKIGKNLSGDETIDAAGLVVCPGFVDIHVHFREPGFESKETIASGSRAAAHGGVTTVVTMANTKPAIDNAGMVEFVHRRARETAVINICPAACATKGMEGKELTEMAELKEVGAVAVTDDGVDIRSSAVMRRVLEYAGMCGLPYLAHCEDHDLSEGGAMNEGFTSTRLGIPGIPKAAEEIAIDRNVRLAEITGAHIHIQHVTTRGGVEIIRRAKERGLRVTAEACPHHWSLADTAIESFDTNAKMNPPLRDEEDRLAIIEAIAEGVFDCLATDHAPHTPTEKDVEFQLAPFGIVGLETFLALGVTYLVEPGHISLERLVELMTAAPAKVIGLNAGTLEEGGPGDVTIFDPKAKWTVNPAESASLSRNTPFAGDELQGQVRTTIRDGKVVFDQESAVLA